METQEIVDTDLRQAPTHVEVHYNLRLLVIAPSSLLVVIRATILSVSLIIPCLS